ncbi:7460_t:CDS:2 [Ambispora leptoticha]|uniref:7460_t:CDS:1 n=1 Tax=Ambispora leptoticha TaxID=144679 RepID=A0A9N9E519_9GLOM|nr:7460_t:CDS:2 [Ambispora leptoticha]
MAAYCVIIGDTIPHVISSLFPHIANIPILDLFVQPSGLALISMVIIVLCIVVKGPLVKPELRGNEKGKWDFAHPQLFQAIGVISFAFVCHHNSLLIFDSLKKPTLNRFATVTHWSTGMSMLACILMALSGYLVFTDKTQGNILNNFPDNDPIVNVARFCFGFNMFTTLPLEAFVCREVIEIYFFNNESFSEKRHRLVTTLLVGGAMIISLITSDLGFVLELTGGFSATALAYILPPACFLRLTSGKWWTRKRLPAVLCIMFGVCVMFLSTFLSIAKAIKG